MSAIADTLWHFAQWSEATSLGRVIRNFDAEFFFKRHHQLDRVEAVGAQIFDEGRGIRDLVGIDIEMFDDDLLHALGSIAHGLVSLSLISNRLGNSAGTTQFGAS